MKTAILYGSKTKLTNAHKAVHHEGGIGQPPYFVRMHTMDSEDVGDALNKAPKPADGEVLLNSVYIT